MSTIARLRTAWAVPVQATLAFVLAFAARSTADDFEALHRMGSAEREEYLAQRDVLLRSHPQPWDIDQACTRSWQAGLGAYILNARLRQPEDFDRWAVEVEQYSKGAHHATPGFGLARARVNIPFAIEFAWKPPAWIGEYKWGAEVVGSHWERSPYDAARGEALYHVTLAPFNEEQPLVLCRVLWENCGIAELRAMAIRSLGWSDTPDDQKQVLEVLLDGTQSLGLRSAALTGYLAKQPPGMVEALIKLLEDRNTPEEIATRCVNGLSNPPDRRLDDPRAQSTLRGIVRDTARPESIRCAALTACCRDPRAEELGLVEAMLTQAEWPVLQRTAVGVAGGLRDVRFRPALRKALYEYGDLLVVNFAVSSLLKLGDEADLAFVRAYLEDPSVPEEARRRAGSALYEYEESLKPKRVISDEEREANWHRWRESQGLPP